MSRKKEEGNDFGSPMKKVAGINAPTYTNTTTVVNIGGVSLDTWDVVKAALAARLNIGLGGGAGMGKSQLFADLQSVFGNNSTYVLGRNDLDIKALFRQMNFKGLKEAMDKGASVSQKELSELTSDIYRPLIVVEEINRCAEIVQNQLFNVFEGFIELDGVKYALGKGDLTKFKGLDGAEFTRNTKYSVGVWSANFGNGQYTGTVTMDKALKERSHLIIDVDNFSPGSDEPSDLDGILMGSAGEVRLKEQESPEDRTKAFVDAFHYMKQKALAPADPVELGLEMLTFRYLVQGLDYIPCGAAKNSKRKMKDVWPSKAEEDSIGNDDHKKMLYRVVYPASPRSALTIVTLARALREYSTAKDSKAKPDVLDSMIESFKLVAPYSGMLENPHRIKEGFVGNYYEAGAKVGEAINSRLGNDDARKLMQAITHFRSQGKPLPKQVVDKCTDDYACFR